MAALDCIDDGHTAPDGPSFNPDLSLAISVHLWIPIGTRRPWVPGEDRGVGQRSDCSRSSSPSRKQ